MQSGTANTIINNTLGLAKPKYRNKNITIAPTIIPVHRQHNGKTKPLILGARSALRLHNGFFPNCPLLF